LHVNKFSKTCSLPSYHSQICIYQILFRNLQWEASGMTSGNFDKNFPKLVHYSWSKIFDFSFLRSQKFHRTSFGNLLFNYSLINTKEFEYWYTKSLFINTCVYYYCIMILTIQIAPIFRFVYVVSVFFDFFEVWIIDFHLLIFFLDHLLCLASLIKTFKLHSKKKRVHNKASQCLVTE